MSDDIKGEMVVSGKCVDCAHKPTIEQCKYDKGVVDDELSTDEELEGCVHFVKENRIW